MMTIARGITKPLLLAIAIALALLSTASTPSSAEKHRLDIDRACSPEVFRPNEWVVFECVVHLTNTGRTPIENLRAGVAGATGLIPDSFRILYSVDGKLMPQSPTDIGVGGQGILQPGQTVEARLVTLLWMDSVGKYEGDWRVWSGDEVLAMMPVTYESRIGAAELPKDLLVTRKLLSAQPGQTAVYETTITNQGSSAVTDLTVTERYNPEAEFVESEPPAASQQADVQIATWELNSFGKQSLVRGGSITLTTTYADPFPSSCDSVPYIIQTGAMMETTVDGKVQRYGARTLDVAAGLCAGDGSAEVVLTPVPYSPVVVAPVTGEGADGATFDVVWTAAFLAAAGAGLVSAALVVRRRGRW
jgi:uncharacterized repeat protein (TIGR01451 family)